MAAINVKRLGAELFEVTVEGKAVTTHTVTARTDYVSKLLGNRLAGNSKDDNEALIKSLVLRSFEFLLERESNTSILRNFDLPVISSYFPEYERVIRAMLD